MSTTVVAEQLEEICHAIWQIKMDKCGARNAMESLATLTAILASWGINSLNVEP